RAFSFIRTVPVILCSGTKTEKAPAFRPAPSLFREMEGSLAAGNRPRLGYRASKGNQCRSCVGRQESYCHWARDVFLFNGRGMLRRGLTKPIGPVIWIFSAQFFVAQLAVQWSWTTPFSLKNNFISDLGNTACGFYPAGSTMYVCSPWHMAM